MVARRIGSEEAKRIPGAQISCFSDFPSGRVSVSKGSYYAIVADSPERGVVVLDRPYKGFVRADADYLVGRAGGDSGSVVCFNYP